MEIKGWEEIEQEKWVTLPIQMRGTITFGNPYKVTFIADIAGLKKLKQEEDERTKPTNAEEAVEGGSSGAEDSEAQH